MNEQLDNRNTYLVEIETKDELEEFLLLLINIDINNRQEREIFYGQENDKKLAS